MKVRGASRKLAWRGGFMLVACGAAVAMATPAMAATYGGYDKNSPHGGETMTGVIYQMPPANPCAHYSNYNAQIVFADRSSAIIMSNSTTKWDEGPGGTYLYNSGCVPGTEMAISGFTYTIRNPMGATVATCTTASYLRNTQPQDDPVNGPSGQDITVTGCGNTIQYSIVNSLAACSPLFAPAACAIGPELY